MRRSVPLSILVILGVLLGPVFAAAQTGEQPGVRGNLYESPSHGWILIAQPPAWELAEAQSSDGFDSVHLVSAAGDGADEYFVSYLDDGGGVDGCVHGLVDSLAATYPDAPLAGWHEPEVEFVNYGDEALAYARVMRDQGPGLDLMAVATCRSRSDTRLIIGDILVQSERDQQGDIVLPFLAPLWPGEMHTGRPRVGQTLAGGVNEGVVRFIARSFPPDADSYAFPFSCLDQETFTRPAEPPPANEGWFACDGKIVNVDIVPATIDLQNIVIGCENVPPGAPPPGCPDEPVPPSQFEVLDGVANTNGSRLTLAPGEYADVVLWYALPGGEPPFELYYAEPDRLVLVGPTFFTQGTGSRAPVIIGR